MSVLHFKVISFLNNTISIELKDQGCAGTSADTVAKNKTLKGAFGDFQQQVLEKFYLVIEEQKLLLGQQNVMIENQNQLIKNQNVLSDKIDRILEKLG